MQDSKNGPGRLTSIWRSYSALIALLAVYLAVTLAYGLLNPLGEAPDETAHMDLIRFIGQEGHLPRDEAQRQAAGYKSDWPMLYHILVGAATKWVDYEVLPHLKANYTTPQHLLIFDGLSPFALIHTDDEKLPYQGIVLAWHLARLASALLSAGTLLVTYAIVVAIRPGQRWLAWGTTAVIAAIPPFHVIASAANDDNLLGLLVALFTLTLVKAWQDPQSGWRYVWLGVWLGLAVTTKYSVILLPFLVLVVLIHAVRRGKLGWRAATSRLLLFCVAIALATAWWFIYLERYFGKAKEQGVATGLINLFGADHITQRLVAFVTGGSISSPSGLPPAGATTWDWAITLFQSFWFVPGYASAAVVTTLSLAFLGLCGLTIAGLWRAWRRGDDLPWPMLGLLALQIGLLLPLPLLRFYLTLNPAETGQGRHILFPAAACVGLLLTWGVAAWFPPAQRRFVGPALAGALLFVSLLSFLGYTLPAFPPRLPVQTSSHALDSLPNPVKVSLDDAIDLAGYEVGQVTQYGTLPVTLVWHSQAQASRDYLVELSLVDRAGRVRGLWLGHPVDGRYPTRAWDPGDVVRDTVWLPLTDVEAGDYALRVRLRSSPEHAGGAGPQAAGKTEVLLTELRLPAFSGSDSAPSSPLPEPMELSLIVWQAGQPVTATMPKYGYRATIPITLFNSQESGATYQISLVGPHGVEQVPQAQAGDTYLFLVDAYWPTGDYRLRVKDGQGQTESDPILRAEVRPRNFDVPPMSTEVRANFSDEIMLLGFDFPERRAQPGDALPITLYWQALRPIDRHYIVSNHLLNRADLVQWGGSDRVPQDYYSTVLWTPGEVIRDDYSLPVHPTAPSGVYRLDIGLYAESAGQTWYLPLVQDGTVLETNNVTIAPIKIGGPPPGVTLSSPSPQQPRADNLEGRLTLLGYDLSLEPEVLYVTLYWRCDARLSADYTTFVHLRNATEQASIVAQMDRPPADGAYPTSLWEPEEIIRDAIQVPLPPQLPEGGFEVVVGLYESSTGRRLLVMDEQGNATGNHIRLEEEITLR
ncbi:MAG: glycosyltransferase family 39 protein [Anaerolineales bacterium]|nr:MAG: glycosyltransferase family 39 protein [Anaerolineales bacterium]